MGLCSQVRISDYQSVLKRCSVDFTPYFLQCVQYSCSKPCWCVGSLRSLLCVTAANSDGFPVYHMVVKYFPSMLFRVVNSCILTDINNGVSNLVYWMRQNNGWQSPPMFQCQSNNLLLTIAHINVLKDSSNWFNINDTSTHLQKLNPWS